MRFSVKVKHFNKDVIYGLSSRSSAKVDVERSVGVRTIVEIGLWPSSLSSVNLVLLGDMSQEDIGEDWSAISALCVQVEARRPGQVDWPRKGVQYTTIGGPAIHSGNVY
jgi:hypothetical protein